MVLRTQVFIAGVDITSYIISWECEHSYGDVLAELTLNCNTNINSAVTLQNGQSIEVYRGWITPTDIHVFSGFITKYEPQGGKIVITGMDKLWNLQRGEMTHIYISTIDSSAGNVSLIFKDIVTTYGGLNADNTTIQDSTGTGITLGQFVCNHVDMYERCQALADLLGWQFYYRADTDKVYFEPKGFTNNANTLTVGTNIISVPRWNYDTTQMCNNVTIVGASQLVETTEIGQIGVTTGYTTTSVTLSSTPDSVKVYWDASNPPTTLRKGGQYGATVSYDYYVVANQKQILPSPSTGAFTGNNYFQTQYSYYAPIPVNYYDQNSIDTYGLFKTTVTYSDIQSVADAQNRAQAYVQKFKNPFLNATISVKNSTNYSLVAGQTIPIVDSFSKPAVNTSFVINKLRTKFPGNFDEIDVGDSFWRLADFIADLAASQKRAQETELSNTDLLSQLVTIDNTATPVIPTPRYQLIQTQSATAPNIFIISNIDHARLGTDKLGGTYGALTNNFIQQYNTDYVETFYDIDFKDAATTATWNTSTDQLTFAAAQVGQSTSIDYNNGTITTATMTVTKSSGTFTYALTANGGTNWETVTSGVAHAFTNTGTDLRWKVTESGGGTGTITKIEINAYH